MLTKKQKEFNTLATRRGVDQDTRMYLLIKLKESENNYSRMINWIEENKDAGQSEIMDYMDIIVPKIQKKLAI